MEILPYAEGVKIGTITSRNNGDAAIAVITNRILNTIRNKDKQQVCFDVGAAQGWWTVLAARHGYNVISFEPDNTGYQELVKNMKLNGLEEQVNCVNAGISNVDAKQILRKNGEQSFIEGLREISADKDANPNWPTVDVETLRLDTVLSDLSNDIIIPLMKVDTEGHELSVFNGCTESFSRIMNVITEFSVYWYGVDPETSVQAGSNFMRLLGSHYKYIYMLSRIGSIYYVGPITPDNYEKFCGVLYEKHLQVDLLFTHQEIPTEWGLTVYPIDSFF